MANPQAAPTEYSGENKQEGFSVKDLFRIVHDATIEAKNKLLKIKDNNEDISIGDMFEMQMIMNHLSQLSETSSSVVQASNQAIQSMAQKISR